MCAYLFDNDGYCLKTRGSDLIVNKRLFHVNDDKRYQLTQILN